MSNSTEQVKCLKCGTPLKDPICPKCGKAHIFYKIGHEYYVADNFDEVDKCLKSLV